MKILNNNYWCYRIDTSNQKFFFDELLEGRLRQGWGYDEGQNLLNFTVDEGASRNRAMFNRVKKGDILLIPQLPTWGDVAIVEATENWNEGYRYEIDPIKDDFGHIFPAKYIKRFKRDNEFVTGNLRSTLKNLSRFWNINHYSADVDSLLNANETELLKLQGYEIRFKNSVETVFNEIFDQKLFSDKIYGKLNEQFTREEWEFALVYGLKRLFPFYQIERTGGSSEVNHGTDILIKLPSIIPNYVYAIAIQVKDYESVVGKEVIEQINKADAYWASENVKLIDKVVIITRAVRDDNLGLLEHDKSVRFIFANELKQILTEISRSFIGLKRKENF